MRVVEAWRADIVGADERREAREHGNEIAQAWRGRLPQPALSRPRPDRAGAERRARDRGGRRMRFEIEGDQREHRLHLAHRDGEGDGACVMAARGELEANIERVRREGRDRKSTRLNSSHTVISYAVFCLKKKKN